MEDFKKLAYAMASLGDDFGFDKGTGYRLARKGNFVYPSDCEFTLYDTEIDLNIYRYLDGNYCISNNNFEFTTGSNVLEFKLDDIHELPWLIKEANRLLLDIINRFVEVREWSKWEGDRSFKVSNSDIVVEMDGDVIIINTAGSGRFEARPIVKMMFDHLAELTPEQKFINGI